MSSSLFLLAFWEISASSKYFQSQPIETSEDGVLVKTNTLTIIANNYVPWLTEIMDFEIYKVSYYLGNYENRQTERLYNLTTDDFIIDKLTWDITHSDSAASSSNTYYNVTTLVGFFIPSMSKNTVTVDYRYNTTQPNFNSLMDSPITDYNIGFSLKRDSGISFRFLFQPILGVVPYDYGPLLLGIIFFSFCTLTGFFSAMYILRDKTRIKELYQDLRTFDTQTPESDEEVAKLTRKIETVKNEPNLLGFPSRLFLGLSFLIFKIRIANWCKHYQCKCIVEGENERFRKVFSEHTEISEKKAFDLIPEKETILAIVGLLTAVGVSLSFDISAIAPALLSIGIFYVFLNIGSSFFLSGKTKETFLPIILLFIGIVAASYQSILNLLG